MRKTESNSLAKGPNNVHPLPHLQSRAGKRQCSGRVVCLYSPDASATAHPVLCQGCIAMRGKDAVGVTRLDHRRVSYTWALSAGAQR